MLLTDSAWPHPFNSLQLFDLCVLRLQLAYSSISGRALRNLPESCEPGTLSTKPLLFCCILQKKIENNRNLRKKQNMFINNNSTCYFQKVILSFCKPRMRVGQGETGGPVYLTDWQGAHSVARSPVIQQCAAPKMAAAAKAVKMSKFRPTMDQAKVTNTYFIIFCVAAIFTRQLIMLCCIFSDKHVYW